MSAYANEYEETHIANPIREVLVDGVAVLKIIKHCNDNFPNLVAGSLLGLDINETLEVTYTYPFPAPQSKSDLEGDALIDDMEGGEYQFEMMKMLQKVNIDNNCVGWYTSVNLGSLFNMETVNSQYTYQSAEELTENCVVLMYDPVLSKKGSLLLKAFRLSDRFLEIRQNKMNEYIKPSDILVEVPLLIKNSGLISAFLYSINDTHRVEIDTDADALTLAGNAAHAEKSLELMGALIDDLLQEQVKFCQYSRSAAKMRQDYVRVFNKRLIENEERRTNDDRLLSMELKDLGMKPFPDAPPRGEALVAMSQLGVYCQQMSEHSTNTLLKIVLTSEIKEVTKPLKLAAAAL